MSMAHIYIYLIMTSTAVQHRLVLCTLVSLSSLFLVNPCSCFNFRKLLNSSYSLDTSGWTPATATWYGSPDGAGSDGGACGYGSAVEQPPFSAMVSAGGPNLYEGDKGCGACYEVMCSSKANALCSANPVTVVLTDNCPDCGDDHFDLSGSAFGAMARSGQSGKLRDAGLLQIQYRRVECNYHGRKIAFRIDSGSNSHYFATLIEYEDGDGDLARVELKQALDSDSWLSMQQLWGAVWKLDDAGSTLRAPFSLRLTSLKSGKTVVADDVIPAGWAPGQTYRSLMNFDT